MGVHICLDEVDAEVERLAQPGHRVARAMSDGQHRLRMPQP
jgi:hypothetical protein